MRRLDAYLTWLYLIQVIEASRIFKKKTCVEMQRNDLQVEINTEFGDRNDSVGASVFAADIAMHHSFALSLMSAEPSKSGVMHWSESTRSRHLSVSCRCLRFWTHNALAPGAIALQGLLLWTAFGKVTVDSPVR